MNELEKKTATFPWALELSEKSAAGNSGLIQGYGSVFDTIDTHHDRVVRGAFSKTLAQWKSKGQLPKMLWQHDAAEPIGYWTDIQEDGHGLLVKGQLLLDLQRGREAYALIKAGVLDSLSIGYQVREAIKGSAEHVRLLTCLDLFEISVVTFPANGAARISHVKHQNKQEY